MTSGLVTIKAKPAAGASCSSLPPLSATETIKWNTGKTSTVALTIKAADRLTSNLTGPVTAGLFKGSHQAGQVLSTLPAEACVSKPLTKFTYKQTVKTGIGESSLRVAFTSPASNGAAITRYSTTCTASVGSNTVTGKASPISLTGLSIGAKYTCVVAATNSRGTGLPSATSAAGSA